MKILHLASWYPNRFLPFDGNFIQRAVASMSEGCENTVIAVLQNPNSHSMRVSVEIAHHTPAGTEIRLYYSAGKGVPFFLKALNKLRAYIRGVSLARKVNKQYDLVHVHVAWPSAIIALLLKKLLHWPYVITEHSTEFMRERNTRFHPFRLLLIRMTARRAEQIMPVSHALMASMQRLGISGNYQVVPNSVDTAVFYPAPQAPPQPPFRFLHISNFSNPAKNVPHILHAAALLRQKRRDFELSIGGDGHIEDLNAWLEEIPESRQFIRVFEALPIEDVADQMRQCHAFVLFSQYETLSCVLQEAMCCGLPSISSRIGGPEEVLSAPGLGMLIPPSDPAVLAAAMDQMINTWSAYDRAWIATQGRERFSLEAVTAAIASAYQKADKRKGKIE